MASLIWKIWAGALSPPFSEKIGVRPLQYGLKFQKDQCVQAPGSDGCEDSSHMSCVLRQVNTMRHRSEFWGLETQYVCSSLNQLPSRGTQGCGISENTNNVLSVLNTGKSVKVLVDSKSGSLYSNTKPLNVSYLCLHSGRNNWGKRLLYYPPAL